MRKRLWPLLALLCFLAAGVFRFALVGYGMSALTCAGLGLVILFYDLTAKWRSKGAKPVRIAVTAALLLGLGCFLAAEIPVIAGARSDRDTKAPFLIVMGAGIRGTEPSLSMLDRLEAALTWLTENPQGTAIVSGCQAADELASEASVMRGWLVAQGVAPERVVLEEQARSSYENLYYSLKLIEQLGGDPAGRVAVASSEYHLYRIRLLGRALGCEPVCVAGRTTYRVLMLNYCIREAFGVWRAWVLGYPDAP